MNRFTGCCSFFFSLRGYPSHFRQKNGSFQMLFRGNTSALWPGSEANLYRPRVGVSRPKRSYIEEEADLRNLLFARAKRAIVGMITFFSLGIGEFCIIFNRPLR